MKSWKNLNLKYFRHAEASAEESNVILRFAQDDKKKKSFTLAEVLITLGIIGVVASMTIPTLINNKAKQETVAKLQKAYTTISNAVETSKADNSGFNIVPYENNHDWDAIATTFIKPYTKISKDCEVSGLNTCTYAIYCPDGVTSIWGGIRDQSTGFYLSDGVFIDVAPWWTVGAPIWVDLNGPNKPNIVGKDLFLFFLTEQGKLVPYSKGDKTANLTDTSFGCNRNGGN